MEFTVLELTEVLKGLHFGLGIPAPTRNDVEKELKRLDTNKDGKISKDEFVEKVAEMIAVELGKPIGYVVVLLNKNDNMSFGGKLTNKGILSYMESIGFGNKKEVLISKLTDYFANSFADVEMRNINIVAIDMPASTVAIGGNFLG